MGLRKKILRIDFQKLVTVIQCNFSFIFIFSFGIFLTTVQIKNN